MHRTIAQLTHRAAGHRRASALWGRIHSGTLVATRGRVGGRWLGAPVLVLETVGRKSGKTRRIPLLYERDGESYVLLAANAGNDRPPAWWLNLQARPTAVVLVRGRRLTVAWREAEAGAEYDRLFAAMAEMYPPARHYAGFTARRMPVVVLSVASA
jgi:deazaflavin-dependent oxidoreductase (nitroreductase family)